MKASMITLVAAAGIVSAQDLPTCAMKCLSEALPDVGCDGITDISCLCSNMNTIMEQGQACFTDSCQSDELDQAMKTAEDLCASFVTTTASDAESSATGGSVDPSPSATTTVMGTIRPDESTTATGTEETDSATDSESESGSAVTTVTQTNSDGEVTGTSTESATGSAVTTVTQTNSDGEVTGTSTESASASATGDDGDSAAAKPLVGAGLAVAAAILVL